VGAEGRGRFWRLEWTGRESCVGELVGQEGLGGTVAVAVRWEADRHRQPHHSPPAVMYGVPDARITWVPGIRYITFAVHAHRKVVLGWYRSLATWQWAGEQWRGWPLRSMYAVRAFAPAYSTSPGTRFLLPLAGRCLGNCGLCERGWPARYAVPVSCCAAG
jgi:hypothetical protein